MDRGVEDPRIPSLAALNCSQVRRSAFSATAPPEGTFLGPPGLLLCPLPLCWTPPRSPLPPNPSPLPGLHPPTDRPTAGAGEGAGRGAAGRAARTPGPPLLPQQFLGRGSPDSTVLSQDGVPAPRGPQAEAAPPRPGSDPGNAAQWVEVGRRFGASAGLWRHLVGASVPAGGAGSVGAWPELPRRGAGREGRPRRFPRLGGRGRGDQSRNSRSPFLRPTPCPCPIVPTFGSPKAPAPQHLPRPCPSVIQARTGSSQVSCVASAGHSTSLSLNIFNNTGVIIAVLLVRVTRSFQESPAPACAGSLALGCLPPPRASLPDSLHAEPFPRGSVPQASGCCGRHGQNRIGSRDSSRSSHFCPVLRHLPGGLCPRVHDQAAAPHAGAGHFCLRQAGAQSPGTAAPRPKGAPGTHS